MSEPLFAVGTIFILGIVWIIVGIFLTVFDYSTFGPDIVIVGGAFAGIGIFIFFLQFLTRRVESKVIPN